MNEVSLQCGLATGLALGRHTTSRVIVTGPLGLQRPGLPTATATANWASGVRLPGWRGNSHPKVLKLAQK